MATFAQAKAILDLRAQSLLKYRNVVAVALGRKNGDPTRDDWCIRVHVTAKTKHRTKHSVPKILHPRRESKWLPSVETDVIAVGRPRLHDAQPITQAGGILSMLDRGTCSGIFRDSDGGALYALTCGHVASPNLTGLHNLDGGYLDVSQEIPCSLASQYTGGNISPSPIGVCVRCSSLETPIDLALVLLDSNHCDPEPNPNVTAIRPLLQAPLQVNETLRVLRAAPHGGPYTVTVTSDTDHYCSTSFPYPTSLGNRTVYYDGLICYPASNGAGDKLQPGDSGSAVVDAANRLVGIHMGASGNDTVAYGVPSDQFIAWASTLSLV